MTEKEAQRALERIGADVETAIQQLIEAPGEASRWPVILRKTLQALENAEVQFPASATSGALRPLIQSLQQRMAQVHLLVESAALFYCGCVAVTTTQGAGYTHQGALEEFAVGGRMQLEA